MTEEKILELIFKLDTTKLSDRDKYWLEIKKLDIDIPKYFLKVYPNFKKWQGRVHLVFSCIKYARESESAFQLGVNALTDKATLVRYRGACILAYSLRDDAIPFLKQNLNHPDKETQQDAKRAIKAIRNKNHHIFMKGVDKWIVNSSTDYKPFETNEKPKKESLLGQIKSIFGK